MARRLLTIALLTCFLNSFLFTAVSLAAPSGVSIETAGDISDLSTYNTGSKTPTANLLELFYAYSIAGTAPNIPTVAGDGLTWVQIATVLDTNSLRRITAFRALGSAPTTGALSIDFGGQAQSGCGWSWSEFSGINTTGTNGSGAIVQSATGITAGTATSLTVTLAAFGSANNGTSGGFGFPLNTAGVPNVGSGFTLLGRANQTSPNLTIGSEWRADNSTSVGMDSAAASVPWAGIAVEIAASTATNPTKFGLPLLGVGN